MQYTRLPRNAAMIGAAEGHQGASVCVYQRGAYYYILHSGGAPRLTERRDAQEFIGWLHDARVALDDTERRGELRSRSGCLTRHAPDPDGYTDPDFTAPLAGAEHPDGLADAVFGPPERTD